MSSTVHGNEITASGIYVDSDGIRKTGGTIRSDGSVRKVVKVRPGYIPPEDQVRYDVREARERRRKRKEESKKESSIPKHRFNELDNSSNSNLNLVDTNHNSIFNDISHTRNSTKTQPKSSKKESVIKDDSGLSEALSNLSIKSNYKKASNPEIHPKKSEDKQDLIPVVSVGGVYVPPFRRNRKNGKT